jgi:hypothetical protein
MSVYARLHAAVWDHAELGTTIGARATEAGWTDWPDRYARRYDVFADDLVAHRGGDSGAATSG